MGRKIHAGGFGLADDAPLPTLDNDNGTLDHCAINVAPYDPKEVVAYLKEKGYPPFAALRVIDMVLMVMGIQFT